MKKYPFRFIARQGVTGLVEVNRGGDIDRCYLPMDVIMQSDFKLSDAQIEAGIPYGLSFVDFLSANAETALHNVGIWTVDDLYNKAQAAVGGLSKTGYKLSEVIKATEAYLHEDHTVIKAAPVAHKKKIKEK